MKARLPRIHPAVDGPGVLVTGAFAVAAWFGAVVPLQAADEIEAERKLRAAATARAVQSLGDELTTAEQRLGAARAQVESLNFDLQPATSVNGRLSEVGRLAGAHNITIDVLRPSEPTTGDQFAAIRVRLEGRARYDQSAAFLSALHAEFPDMLTRDFRVSTQVVSPEYTGQFAVSLVWYTKPL